METINRYIVKDKGVITHSVFLIKEKQMIGREMTERYRIVSSLPHPLSMVFFLKQKNSFTLHRDAFKEFTLFIRFMHKNDIAPYRFVSDFPERLKKNAEYIDKIRSWFKYAPNFNVASPTYNKHIYWCLSSDIIALPNFFKDMARLEIEKVTRKKFESVLTKKDMKDEYVEHYLNLNNSFYRSELDFGGYYLYWAEGKYKGKNYPLIFMVNKMF